MVRTNFANVKYYLSVSIIQMGTLLFILTVSGLYQPLYTTQAVYQPLVEFKPKPVARLILSGKPARLSLPAIQIDKELLDGIYNSSDASWTLSPRGIHYAIGSALANDDSGSTFIYGHNNKHVFGALPNLKEGDIAKITTDNNLVFTYTYTSKETLNPSDTSPLNYTGSPRLTLQTCSGSWYQNRELFYFNLTDVSPLTLNDSSKTNGVVSL